MANFFKNFVFSRLPIYYRETDPAKDSNNEGVLQRYLQVFGLELDNNVRPYIDDFFKLYNVMECPDKMLLHLGSNLGYPPTLIANNTDLYRKILKFSIQLYKVKGACLSYKMLFNLIGLEVDVIALVPRKKITYDMSPDPAIYDKDGGEDDTEDQNHYDSECDYCSGFYLAVGSIEDTCNPPTLHDLTDEQLLAIQNIICWITPINAQYLGMQPRVKVCDRINLHLDDSYGLCSRPTDVQWVFEDDTHYKVVWSGDSPGAHYEVRYRTTAGITMGPWINVVGLQDFNDPPIITVSGTDSYELQIRHVCKAGDESPWVSGFIILGFGIANQSGLTMDVQNVTWTHLPDPSESATLSPGILANYTIGGLDDDIHDGFYDTIDITFGGTATPTQGKLITNNGDTTIIGYQYDDHTLRFENVTIAHQMTIILQ